MSHPTVVPWLLQLRKERVRLPTWGERAGLELAGQAGVWGVLGPPLPRQTGWSEHREVYSPMWTFDREGSWHSSPGCGTRQVSWSQGSPVTTAWEWISPSGVHRGQVGWSRSSKGSKTGWRQREECFQHLTASVSLIAPLGSRAWVILKLFLERGLPVRVTWILKKKTNTRTKPHVQTAAGKEYGGQSVSEAGECTHCSRERRGVVASMGISQDRRWHQEKQTVKVRRERPPEVLGGLAVGAQAQWAVRPLPQRWFWAAVKGLCWEEGKHRADEAALSPKCDQATRSLKMGRLLEPRASLVAQMVKNLSAMQETRFDSWVGKMLWRREWQPTPVFLPGGSQGQRSLEGYSPWGHKELDITEWLLGPKWVKSHVLPEKSPGARKCFWQKWPKAVVGQGEHVLPVPTGPATCSGCHDFPLIPSSGQELVYSRGLSQEISFKMDLSGGSVGKESTSNAGGTGDPCSIPGLGRSPGEGNGYPLQYSCLGDPRDIGAWWDSVHGITKSQTRLKWHSMHPFYYCCFLFFNFYLYSLFQLFFLWFILLFLFLRLSSKFIFLFNNKPFKAINSQLE